MGQSRGSGSLARCILLLSSASLASALSAAIGAPRSLHSLPNRHGNAAHIVRIRSDVRPVMAMSESQLRAPPMPKPARAVAFGAAAQQTSKASSRLQATATDISVAQTSINLVKSIVGAGALTLPSGLAYLMETGASPAMAMAIGVALVLSFGVFSAYGFYLIGESCAKSGAKTYQEVWSTMVGRESSWLPAVASLTLCGTGAVGCLAVIGDTFADVLSALLSLPADTFDPHALLSGISLALLLPLCMLPSLAPLSIASLLGVVGIAGTAVAMLMRVVDGTYPTPFGTYPTPFGTYPTPFSPSAGSGVASVAVDGAARGAARGAASAATSAAAGAAAGAADGFEGAFAMGAEALGTTAASVADAGLLAAADATAAATAGTMALAGDAAALASASSALPTLGGVAFFVSLLSNAFLAHYSAPAYFDQLEGESTEHRLRSFKSVVTSAFSASGLLLLLVTLAGFATFGAASEPMILNSYATDDPLALLARAGVGICVLCEFPLLERPFRQTLGELMGAPHATPLATALSVGLITALAAAGARLDLISALGGASGGSFLIYVAPALMALSVGGEIERGPALRMLIAIGGLLGALGVFEVVSSAL